MDKYLNDEAIKIIEGTSTGYEEDNSKLTDTHIDAYIKLVPECSQFNIRTPLYPQVPEKIAPIDLDKPHIQILFSGPSTSGHWSCMYYNQKKLHVYDSLNSKFLYTEHKVFLNRLFPNKDGLHRAFENVIMQRNNYDCGVFAIVFALIYNTYPCLLNFKTKKEMRKHLVGIC